MQIQSVLLILVFGAVAVLAKIETIFGPIPDMEEISVYSNYDTQPMFVASRPMGKRKPNRGPQGRPFQVQQQMGGRYPEMTAYTSQRPGMQQSFGPQRPFGQNSFSGYPSQQYSFNNPSSYPSMGSSRPFYAGRPNFNDRPNQFPGNAHMSAGAQYPGGNQFPGNAQWSAGYQTPGNGAFPSGNAQFSANAQLPGGNPFPGNSQVSANSSFPGQGQPSLNTQFPGTTFPMNS